jgi:hypothetical protein
MEVDNMTYFTPNKNFMGILFILLGLFLIMSPIKFTEVVIISLATITIIFSIHNLIMLRKTNLLNTNILLKYLNNMLIATFVILYPVFVFRLIALNIIINMIITKQFNIYKLILTLVLLLRPDFIIDFTLNIIGLFILLIGVALLNNKEIL